MNEKTVKAQLILENGMRFDGRAFGYIKETVGEVVFNTGMTGYEELLTELQEVGLSELEADRTEKMKQK